ncbi:MAG: hypothetical protein ABMA25_04940 [Ilumatobacteraceae bacterium]
MFVAASLVAALSSFSLGCSKDSNDDNLEPSIPAGGETGTNPGPTLSPNGLTVPTT